MVSHTVWKTLPSSLRYDKNLGLRHRFLSTESLGPYFSQGMGDHDQILQYSRCGIQISAKADYCPLAFQPEGVLFCLRLSVCLTVRPPAKFTLSTRWFVEDFNWNYQISTKRAYWDTGLVLKMEVIDLDLQYHLVTWHRILGNLDCLRDNSSQISSRITKFAPNMHPRILSTAIWNGGHWPWNQGHFGYFDIEFHETSQTCSCIYFA